ncbi:hypothetical protein RUM43_007689 [Polyplax serrata]|uniref:Protein SERAC1 n=1 Tax=Polyplax serrata TaxID=468196 RepID=A0AAN8PD32_POLSC
MNDEPGCNHDNLKLVSPVDANARWLTKVHIIATSVNLFLRLTASFAVAAYDAWLLKQERFVQRLKTLFVLPSVYILTSKFSLSSFTTITHTSTKFDFIYQVIRKPITGCRTSVKWFPKRTVESVPAIGEPELSVHVDVLYDPAPSPVRADVIFIHGLHGSLYNTWKQGLWGHRKQVQNLPLQHRNKVEESAGLEKLDKGVSGTNKHSDTRKRFVSLGSSDPEYDHLLESITDLLNNIDDTLKESKQTSDEEEPYSPCWPRDWLPKDCPGVRVLAVNYTTDPFLWRPVWVNERIRSTMSQRSQEMTEHLLQLGVGNNPMVWVGHSKGGLYVKQMLVDASESCDSRLSNFLTQTKGIMFYSVPHRGSSLANWNIPLLRKSVELTEVKKDCDNVLDLHRKFIKLFEDKFLTAEVFSFVETVLTFMFVTNVRVVTVDSADLGLGSFRGVNIDHREICKPLNRDCFLYKELISLIKRVSENHSKALTN